MNRQIHLITFLFLPFLIFCQTQNTTTSITNSPKYSLPIDTAFVPTDSSQFYFPLEVLRDTSSYIGRDTFFNTWYSKHLFVMREPIFYADKSQSEIYRFTWLRTFNNPIAIRIEKRGESYVLYWKCCNGAGGYRPGKLVTNKKKVINKATWDEFQNHLKQIDFWRLETNQKNLGTDGSQWILEGKAAGEYHVTDRWAPNEKSDYYQCCDFLIRLTDLKIKADDKY